MNKKRITYFCRLLRKISIFISDWITKQPEVKEESITDLMLYRISDRIPNIKYHAFNRIEEGKITGADWEWWLIFQTFCVKYRVQAKKLTPLQDNYNSIAYTNKRGLQIDMLISDSIKSNSIPIYAFYTNRAKHVLCQAGITDEGVYLADAVRILDSFITPGKRFTDNDEVIKQSIPLSCILCCKMFNQQSASTQKYIDFLHTYFSESIAHSNDAKDKLLGFHEEIPQYIQAFLDSSNESLQNLWEKQYKQYIEDINGLLVFDIRQLDYSEEGAIDSHT